MSFLTVLTPAPVTDLIELTALKLRLGITDSSEDSLLAQFIDDVSSAYREEGAFGHELARQRYTETFFLKRFAQKEIQLRCKPVDPDSVTVTIDDVANTDFEIRHAGRGLLYLSNGWPTDEEIVVTYKGGFLIPAAATAKGVVTSWATGTAYAVGAWVRPVATQSALRFECTAATGNSGASEPTWPTTAGSTVVDGSVTWTARQAEELPTIIAQLASIAIRDFRDFSARPAGLLSSEGDTFRETYSAPSTPTVGLSEAHLKALGPLIARYGARI